jgi:4-hydroxybenzoate polyprenyltransferase
MLFTREGWTMAAASAAFGFLAMAWLGWPLALVGIPLGFALFTAYAYLRG